MWEANKRTTSYTFTDWIWKLLYSILNTVNILIINAFCIHTFPNMWWWRWRRRWRRRPIKTVVSFHLHDGVRLNKSFGRAANLHRGRAGEPALIFNGRARRRRGRQGLIGAGAMRSDEYAPTITMNVGQICVWARRPNMNIGPMDELD